MVQATATARTSNMTLEDYFAYVAQHGALRTPTHAHYWSRATLNMLGVNLSKGVKKKLAAALPEELERELTRVFWVAYFRDTNMPAHEFQNRVARRAGNTDPQFARIPVTAVFGGVKQLISRELSDEIAKDLAPEVRALWENG
jgi:uncharacterized protein (DUF2267 family)